MVCLVCGIWHFLLFPVLGIALPVLVLEFVCVCGGFVGFLFLGNLCDDWLLLGSFLVILVRMCLLGGFLSLR